MKQLSENCIIHDNGNVLIFYFIYILHGDGKNYVVVKKNKCYDHLYGLE